jgi:polysaccharide export outer membrane protein
LPPVVNKGEGLIHPRDTIVVSVRDQTAMSGEFVVRDDGGVLLPTMGEVTVAGRTPEAVREELHQRATSLVVRPAVAVSIARVAPIRVNVVGEVKAPASYELTRDRTVAAALAAAGWLTEFADRDRIFVVRREGELRVRFRAGEITALDPAVARFRLNDGDVVVVE